jgi:creatinine amidohydrolase/Fe(II)-dependent formamide hydrolase-like protein
MGNEHGAGHPPRPGGDDRPATRRDDFASAFYVPDYGRPSRVDVARTIDQASPLGAFGYPEAATPKKGEALLAVATREVVAFVREFARWPATLDQDTSA